MRYSAVLIRHSLASDSNPMVAAKRILVVEDESKIRDGVLAYLEEEGYSTSGVGNGRHAFSLLELGSYDLVILDGNLPGVDGFKVLETLRAGGMTIPVLMLTARASEEDRLHGFQLGADDYLVKPFYMSELGVRIQLLLNRAAALASLKGSQLRSGPLQLDPTRRVVQKEGKPLPLLPKEVRILEVFLRHAGRTLSWDRLAQEAWDRGSQPTHRTVEAHITRLRRKLGSDEGWLATVPGEGYRWDIPVEPVEGEA